MPFRTAMLLALLSSVALGAPGGIEVWYFQAAQDLPKTEQTSHPPDVSGDAEVTHRTDHWKIDGLRLDSQALHIGSIYAESTGDLRVKKRVVVDLKFKKIDQTVVAFDIRGAKVVLSLNLPVSFTMPETIELQCVQHHGEAKLTLTEAGRNALKDHFTKALNDFLSETSFDKNFSYRFTNMNDAQRTIFETAFHFTKHDILANLRSHLAAEMDRPGYWERFLGDIARTFPVPAAKNDQTIVLVMDRRAIQIPDRKIRLPLPENTWVVREKDAPLRFQTSTFMEIPQLPIVRPSGALVIAGSRLGDLVAEYFAHAPENSDLGKLSLTPERDAVMYAPASMERAEIAQWIASVDAPTDAKPTRVLGLEFAGAHAPVVQPWYHPSQGDRAADNFIDVWLSARWIDRADPTAPQPRLGLLLVFSISKDGRLHLVQLSPYKPGATVGPAVDLKDAKSFGNTLGVKMESLLLQSLLNARLEAFQPGVRGANGIRMIGNRGARAPGEVLADALAVDLTVR